MRHEPKIMTAGPTLARKSKQFRSLKCPECGIAGGECTTGSFGPTTRTCCGFDDDTGRPCRQLPPKPPEADTPVEIQAKASA